MTKTEIAVFMALILFAVGIWLWNGVAWLWDFFEIEDISAPTTEGVTALLWVGFVPVALCVLVQWARNGLCSRSFWSLAILPLYWFGGGTDVLVYLVHGPDLLLWFGLVPIRAGSPTIWNWSGALCVVVWSTIYLFPGEWTQQEEPSNNALPDGAEQKGQDK